VKQRNNVSNFQMMVEETSDGLLFLHQLQICEASFSYGIEAALLSGVPSPVVLRAHQLLDPLAA